MACNTALLYDFDFDCNADMSSGLMEMAVINKDDIKTAVKTGNGVAITLKTGKKANKITVYKKSAGYTTAGKVNENAPSKLSFNVFFTSYKKAKEEAAALSSIRNGNFVIVAKLKQLDKFEVLGLDAGLEFSNQEGDSNANSGSQKVTLATPADAIGDDIYYLNDSAAYAALFVTAS